MAGKTLRWLRCRVLRKHRPNSEDFYEACLDCGWWKRDD